MPLLVPTSLDSGAVEWFSVKAEPLVFFRIFRVLRKEDLSIMVSVIPE